MDNRYDDLAVALGEIAERRDKRLRDPAAAIAAHRLQRLHALVATKIPIETALRTVSNNRDESLEESLALPTHIELLLHRRLLAQQPRRMQRGASKGWVTAVQAFWPTFQTPAQLTAALALIVLAIGALQSARFGTDHRSGVASQYAWDSHTATQAGASSAYEDRVEQSFLRTSGNVLTLRVSTIELASLQSSVFPIDRALLARGHDFDRGLPLDLPVRQLLIDGETTAVP